MSHDLTRWIEAAEARRFSEAAILDRQWRLRDGSRVSNTSSEMPAWLQALAHVRHRQPRRRV